ncbi:hypothetical protein IGI04_034853 [Brassica rapa subsp. trilocularis]|uniref:CCHC-type domain-containing protein n=1 Tax=Brassica rapa subsp. trilocularis TaxID=1813537 RepID=A0ABQ7LD40_BRACM|nr:hypothetical protein IGI04_034853 [Brassica rapa subsp. trilocularis]
MLIVVIQGSAFWISLHDLEPSERDIGELSQPPTTEIRSATPPPSHSLDESGAGVSAGDPPRRAHTRRRKFPRVNPRAAISAGHSPEQTAAGHRPFAEGKPPPHRRRVSAAAGDFPVSHHRRWPPPATGLRRLAGRLAAGVHSYHFSTLLRGSETSGLAMLLVRACGAETFVSWMLLERAGVQRHIVLATLRIIYPYEEMRGWEFYLLKSVVCVFSIPIPHGVRLTSRSNCYRIGALGVLFLLFSDFRFYDFIDISGFISFIAFMLFWKIRVLQFGIRAGFRPGSDPGWRFMPPRKRVVREGGDEHVLPPVPPIDQDALRQMVQDAARQAAQEAVQQAVQEAARVAAQEVVRQMASAQQGQQVPPVQAHGHQQPPIQPVPPVQVQGQQQPPIQHVSGIFQVPPPAPPVLLGQVPEVVPPVLPGQVPEVDETLMRVMRQMKTVGLETFEGTVDPGAAYKWKHRLASCLQTINCPLRLCLNIAELYLRGDALVWWDGVRSMRDGDMTYEDFLIAFDKKYFPREALHQKRNAFEHLRQGTRSIREYKREFFQLRLFAGNHFDGEDLIRRFLDGMRVDLCGRGSMVTYTSLEDLVEKAVVQEACVAEEQKYSKAPLKTRRTSEPQKRTWEQLGTPSCDKCRRHHFGECITCFNCGKMGHKSRDCRSRPFGARGVAPAAPAGQAAAAQTAPVAQGAHAAPAAAYAPGACFTCGQFGHISRKSLRRQTPADLEPSERDIGELSQPPSTEIRSVTPPPSHPLGNPQTVFSDWLSIGRLVNRRYLSNHWVSRDFKATSVFVTLRRVRSRSFSPRSAATRSHAQNEVPRVNRTRRHLRRTFAGATAAGHCPFAAGKPPPVIFRGSETSGLAMLLVRACGAETFVSWMLLERAGASCVFMLELNFHSGSSIYSSETDEQEGPVNNVSIGRSSSLVGEREIERVLKEKGKLLLHTWRP